MLQQEKEFKAWGLSNLAIRNIILFFFAVLLTIIAALCRVVVWIYNDKLQAEAREIITKDQAAKIINDLRLEQITMLKEAMQRQDEIEKGIREARDRIRKIEKEK